MPRYSVKIGGQEYDVLLKVEGDKILVAVNGKEFQVVSHSLGKTRTLLSVNSKTTEIDIHPNGNGTRLVFLNGFDLEASVEEYGLSQLKKVAGLSDSRSMESSLKAAMPGMVVDIKVAPGDSVDEGTPLLVLEAMKMENVIKAKGKAVVKSIKVKAKDAVEKGDILLEFE